MSFVSIYGIICYSRCGNVDDGVDIVHPRSLIVGNIEHCRSLWLIVHSIIILLLQQCA